MNVQTTLINNFNNLLTAIGIFLEKENISNTILGVKKIEMINESIKVLVTIDNKNDEVCLLLRKNKKGVFSMLDPNTFERINYSITRI